MRGILLAAVISLVVNSIGYCQEQPLNSATTSDKEAYGVVGKGANLSNGKIPLTEIQRGKADAWFLDWDFGTDNSNNSAANKSQLKQNHIYFYGLFNDQGWIKELRYYDMNGVHQWTKIFYYPDQTNDTGEYLSHSYKYFTPDGKEIDHAKQEQIVKSYSSWGDGTPKERILEVLGNPLVTTVDSFGMQNMIYFDGTSQHWYVFNKEGKLDYGNYPE